MYFHVRWSLVPFGYKFIITEYFIHSTRSGEVCRQRWNEMVRYLGGHKEKPFIEQVEVLSKRYCPEMVDYREGEA